MKNLEYALSSVCLKPVGVQAARNCIERLPDGRPFPAQSSPCSMKGFLPTAWNFPSSTTWFSAALPRPPGSPAGEVHAIGQTDGIPRHCDRAL